MRSNAVCVLASVALAAFAQPLVGGTIPFFDDFEDGDYADGTPVLWNRANDGHGDPGTHEIVDGSLVMSGTGYSSIWVDGTLDTTDVSLRATVRFLTNSGDWHLTARADYSVNHFYWGAIEADGEIWIGDWAFGRGIIVYDHVPTDWDPVAEDVSLRLDVVDVEGGVELALFAWGEGETMPDQPQLRHTDSDDVLLDKGMVGMFVQHGSPTTVAVRHFEAVPEPSSLVLTVIALSAVAGLGRLRKRSF